MGFIDPTEDNYALKLALAQQADKLLSEEHIILNLLMIPFIISKPRVNCPSVSWNLKQSQLKLPKRTCQCSTKSLGFHERWVNT
jgi:hypothetical protein